MQKKLLLLTGLHAYQTDIINWSYLNTGPEHVCSY